MDIKDLAGLSEPLKKLIEVVSNGIGQIYFPKSEAKRIALASESRRQQAIAEAEAEITKTVMLAENGIFQVRGDRSYDKELLHRAAERFTKKFIDGQVNIEKIVDHAAENISHECSSENVDKDWIRRFFSYADDISDIEFQKLWGQILAGEVTKPGSYSLGLLEVLRKIDKKDAEKFQKLCRIAPNDGYILLVQGNIELTLAFAGLKFGDVLELMALGLVNSKIDNLGLKRSSEAVVVNFGKKRIVLNGKGLPEKVMPSILLTRAGIELMNLICADIEFNEDYIKTFASFYRSTTCVVKSVPDGFPDPIPLELVAFLPDY